MLDTVLFDMGGTLEDIWYNDQTSRDVTQEITNILIQNGLPPNCDAETFWTIISDGVTKYKTWSQSLMLEKKPEEIWTKYYLKDLGFPNDKLEVIAEKLAQTWECVYYRRELRPNVKETLEILKTRGYKLGIISNTASLYSVFNVLEEYGIREYFQDVTLSSVTGYRKPHTGIFEIALRQMCVEAKNCVYVGDTISRDIIGAKKSGFGKAVQISSFMTEHSDSAVQGDEFVPDHIIGDIGELVDYLGDIV